MVAAGVKRTAQARPCFAGGFGFFVFSRPAPNMLLKTASEKFNSIILSPDIPFFYGPNVVLAASRQLVRRPQHFLVHTYGIE